MNCHLLLKYTNQRTLLVVTNLDFTATVGYFTGICVCHAVPTTERKGTWVGLTAHITYTGNGNNNSKDKDIPVHTLKANRRMEV
jgi:hypothetical protein